MDQCERELKAVSPGEVIQRWPEKTMYVFESLIFVVKNCSRVHGYYVSYRSPVKLFC